MNEKSKISYVTHQPKIAVIGAGIIGLTCVAELIESGYKNITVYADKVTPYTTSDVAAAICETEKSYPEPEKTWYKNNLFKLEQLLLNDNVGVSKINYLEICKQKIVKQNDNDVYNLPAGYFCKLKKNIYLINSTVCMSYLLKRLVSRNITINIEKITNIDKLTSQYDVIVNCTGLGSKALFNDHSVFPIRGQIVIISKPENLNYCLAELTENITYIIPRGEECILGGTAEVNNWDLNPDENTTDLIVKRAQLLVPSFKYEKIVGVKVGLRPGRNRIRLETEIINQCLIVHNYGHGGEGYSFAWGSAKAVRDILNKELS